MLAEPAPAQPLAVAGPASDPPARALTEDLVFAAKMCYGHAGCSPSPDRQHRLTGTVRSKLRSWHMRVRAHTHTHALCLGPGAICSLQANTED